MFRNPVLIRKRCGSVRWCVDYRALNALTIKDVFPLPLVDECLDTLAGNVWYQVKLTFSKHIFKLA
jgi:hypothetical protein